MKTYVTVIKRDEIGNNEMLGYFENTLTYLPRIGEALVGKVQTPEKLRTIGGRIVDVEHNINDSSDIRIYIR